jgi:hypothetical protein
MARSGRAGAVESVVPLQRDVDGGDTTLGLELAPERHCTPEASSNRNAYKVSATPVANSSKRPLTQGWGDCRPAMRIPRAGVVHAQQLEVIPLVLVALEVWQDLLRPTHLDGRAEVFLRRPRQPPPCPRPRSGWPTLSQE